MKLIKRMSEGVEKSGELKQKKWYAIYTKYKAEKYVAENLKKKGIETYIPLKVSVKRYLRKIKRNYIPLINCYVFVRIFEDEKIKILESEYVFKFIKTGEKIDSIPDQEIEILKKVTGEHKASINAEPSEWRRGDKVEIIVGNLVGTKGHIIEKKGQKVFIIALETLGIDLEMEVDKSFLALVG